MAAGVVALCLATGLVFVPKLRTEFLPPFDEGVILYMPSMISGVSVAEARHCSRQPIARSSNSQRSSMSLARLVGQTQRPTRHLDVRDFDCLTVA